MKRVKLKQIELDHSDTEGSWAVSYGDMITLLLSFFVIFFSFDFKEEREKKLEQSVMNNISLMNTKEVDNKGFDSLSTATLEDLNQITAVVKKESNGKFVVFFKGANFFESGETKVNTFGKALLDKFIAKYLPYAGKYVVKIQAFTDDRPVSPGEHRYKDNIELSALRSISVLRYLQTNGLPLNRVEIGGKGIMSKKALAALGLESRSIAEVRRMSRTIALVLYREDVK